MALHACSQGCEDLESRYIFLLQVVKSIPYIQSTPFAPFPSEYTLPAVRHRRISRPRVHIPPRPPTVLPLEGNLARIQRLVDIGRSQHRIRGDPFLDPPDHGHQHVAFRVQRVVARDVLPDEGGAGPTGAVAHATDAEEAVELVQLGVVEAHRLRDVLVVPRRVEARDDGVLLAVVVQDLGPFVLDGGQVPVPRHDVEEVVRGEVGVVLRVEGGGVPGRVVVQGVAHVVLRVQEGLAGVDDGRREDLGAGLHGGVHETVILGVVHGLEVLADRLGLGLGEARARVAAG